MESNLPACNNSTPKTISNRPRNARNPKGVCFVLLLSMTTPNASAFNHPVGPSSSRSKDTRALGSSAAYYPLPRQQASPALDPVRIRRKPRNESVDKLFPKEAKFAQEVEYEQRKEEWASRFADVGSLREAFGSNKNLFWGDLDPTMTRRLYKTLMPRSLFELLKFGAQPEDLAPLAYQARVAAKMYARERSTVPGRIAATTFDILRNFQKYGKFQPNGMSYDQIWEKYRALVLEETAEEPLTEQDLTVRVCLKILEGSCQTHEGIDGVLLDNPSCTTVRAQEQDLRDIIDQLDQDVQELLLQGAGDADKGAISSQRIFTLRLLARAKRRFAACSTISVFEQ